MGGIRARWSDGDVTFLSHADYVEEFELFLAKGAVLVGGDVPAGGDEFPLRICPPGQEPVALRGRVAASRDGGRLVQLVGFGPELVDRLRPLAPVRALKGGKASAPRPAPGAHKNQAISGTLCSPARIEDLHLLPWGATFAATVLSPISGVGLLRHLGDRGATGRLTLSGRRVARAFDLFGGRVRLTDEEHALHNALFWPAGSYAFKPCQPPSLEDERQQWVASYVPAWEACVLALRHRIDTAQEKTTRRYVGAPAVLAVRAGFLERSASLRLSDGDEYFVERWCDGKNTLGQALSQYSGREKWLYGLLAFLKALGYLDASGAGPLEDEAKERLARGKGDPFALLGFHWSDPPSKLPAVALALYRRFAPGSDAARAWPESSARLVAEIEGARRHLGDRAGRRTAREALGVDVGGVARFLASQIPMAKSLGEFERARDLAEAALDLVDDPALEDELRRLTALLAGARAKR